MLTDTQIDTIVSAIFALPGVSTEHDSNVVVENVTDDTLFIKFMSDHGITDKPNGNAFANFLHSKYASFEQTDIRKFLIKEAVLECLFL